MGVSPAVLTETVWALAHETPACIPDRIVVLTTTRGRAALVESLFETPRWAGLLRALEAAGVRVGRRLRFGPAADHVALLPALDGSHDLSDILTTADARSCANGILRHVRTYTETPSTTLIASVAGGRKTMGALAMACMTLAARPMDRVLHVLVAPPYDGALLEPPFFYPCEHATHRLRTDPATVYSGDADVTLVDIPFVRMRRAPQPWIETPATYEDMVAMTQESLAATAWPEVVLDSVRGALAIGSAAVTVLTPVEYAVLLAILELTAAGAAPRSWDSLEDRLRELRGRTGVPAQSVWLHDFQAAAPLDIKEDVRKSVSRIRAKLRAVGIASRVVARLLPSLHAPGEAYPRDRIRIEGGA